MWHQKTIDLFENYTPMIKNLHYKGVGLSLRFSIVTHTTKLASFNFNMVASHYYIMLLLDYLVAGGME